MKKLYYDEGMPVMGFGKAGEFRINEPKEVPDDLAEKLLRKGRLKEVQEAQSPKLKAQRTGPTENGPRKTEHAID